MASSSKKDKINDSASTSTTESLGISGSSNIATESSGFIGDDSKSLFPHLKEEKSWSSTTSSNLDDEIDVRTGAVNRK